MTTSERVETISAEQRRIARMLAGLGLTRRQVAAYLMIDEVTLTAAMGRELDQAEAEALAKVAKSLFTMATQKNNVAAAIFWMKARANWSEKQQVEVSRKDPSPPPVLTIDTDDPNEAARMYLRLIRG
jgi:hypothetical protein